MHKLLSIQNIRDPHSHPPHTHMHTRRPNTMSQTIEPPGFTARHRNNLILMILMAVWALTIRICHIVYNHFDVRSKTRAKFKRCVWFPKRWIQNGLICTNICRIERQWQPLLLIPHRLCDISILVLISFGNISRCGGKLSVICYSVRRKKKILLGSDFGHNSVECHTQIESRWMCHE